MMPPEGKPFLLFLLKLLFIYSKLEDGWSVSKLAPNQFEFTKSTESAITMR